MVRVISIIDDQGVERFLGNNEPDGPLRFGGPIYGDAPTTPMISRSRWPELIAGYMLGPDHPFLPPVHDQDGIGQCNADATAGMTEFARALAGQPFVQLSAADLYHRINGGRDQGSLLEDAMQELTARGIGTAATCGTLWDRAFRPAPEAERLRFRALEVWLCPNFDCVMSAILSGFAVNSGILWYANYRPDAEGWLPERRQGGAGGHAVMGYKPAVRDGRFGIWHQNSWTTQWGGFGGRCVFPEAAYSREIGGCWALRAVVDEGGGLPPPA